MDNNILQTTINDMVIKGRGILAADESHSTIAKRFASINVECTEESRRAYRELLITTPNLNEFISGIILFEETLTQADHKGQKFSDILKQHKIVPGIKVDKGLVNLGLCAEKVTQGLDGLSERLLTYQQQGARFAKWRATYDISAQLPSQTAIVANAECLARYAAICQANNIVPIVEPEVLMDGNHTIERCAEVTEAVLLTVFRHLHLHRVNLEFIVLKPSMVISGKDCASKASHAQVAAETIKILRRCVPAAVPSINFLSGGQSDLEATLNLNAMNNLGTQPWYLSFSYGRALQAPSLKAWQGKEANVKTAQHALYLRSKLNGLAAVGQYAEDMEKEAA